LFFILFAHAENSFDCNRDVVMSYNGVGFFSNMATITLL